jgi:hypothetical protein
MVVTEGVAAFLGCAAASKEAERRRMKRFGLAVGAVSLLAVSIPAIATGAGDRDSVVGAIKRTSLNGQLDQHHILSAHQMPKGGAQGQYQATYDDQAGNRIGYKGKVTCVRVEGKRAVVGIEILPGETHPAISAGQGQFLYITDRGNPSDPGQDTISPGAGFATPPTTCDIPREITTPTYSGNLTLKDGG